MEKLTFVIPTLLGVEGLTADELRRLEMEDVPGALRGTPIALITAGLLAMAFMGFAGLVALP